MNAKWKCPTIDSKEMWHKTKNIKKNFETFVESQTPLKGSKSNPLSATDRAVNDEARKLLLALGPSLKRHFYRCCKTARGIDW